MRSSFEFSQDGGLVKTLPPNKIFVAVTSPRVATSETVTFHLGIFGAASSVPSARGPYMPCWVSQP